MRKILNYKIFQLNDVAGGFLQNRLKNITPLSNLIKSEVEHNIGNFFTFFPEDTSVAQLNDFNSGGILEVDPSKTTFSHGMKIEAVPNTLDGLADYMHNYFNKSTNNILLLEDFLAKPDDQYVQRLDYKKVIIGTHVYYWFSNKDKEEAIIQAIKHCSSKPEAIGVFSKVSNIDLYLNQNILGKSFLSEAVENIRALYVEAYDHEGYVVWEK